jgi:flagellin-like hook-associated protein FlgL
MVMSSISAIATDRVTQQMKRNALLGSLQTDQSQLLTLENQLTTGKRLTQASDDPTAAVGIIRLNAQIQTTTQYSSNLNFANSSLGAALNSLTTLSNLTSSASTIASSSLNTGPNSSPAERASQAQLVDTLINQAIDLANTQYQGQSVFGGQNTSAAAYTSINGGYAYNGTFGGQSLLTPTGGSLSYTLDGSSVFGGGTVQVGGTTPLSPALTASTKLSSLTGATGAGVTGGPITVTVGSTTVTVDLTHAATAGDVVNQINAAFTAAGSSASISLSGGSFAVTGDGAQSLTIADTSGGKTAAELGLAGTVAAAASSTGPNVSAAVTPTTPLSALNGGAGIDPSGFILTNGSKTATITLTGLNTVQDLLNAINKSGTGVTAAITPDGKSIDVQNDVSGSGLAIGENGGTTAADLGIRSFTPATTLASLNQNQGVTFASATSAAPAGTLLFTKTDGTQFSVKVDGVSTPSQLVAAINAATGNTTVTAALNSTGNGITLTDSSGGPGDLSVSAAPDFNESQLGLPATGTGGTLTTAATTFGTDDLQITRKDGTRFSVNLTGATTIQDVLNKINNADGNTGTNPHVTASLNSTGNGIQLSDTFSTGTGALTVTALNGSTAATALGIAKTAASGTPGTINGDDVNPAEPQGLLSSLIMLRNALMNNDPAGITQAGTLLQANATQVNSVTGQVSASMQDISTRQTSITTEQTQMQVSLIALQGTDEATTISQYESLQTAYQAALQVAQTTQNLSLLDFLTA